MYRRTRRTVRLRISYIYEHTGHMHTQRNETRRTDRNMNVSYIACPHCTLITVTYTHTYVPTVLYSRPATKLYGISTIFQRFQPFPRLNSRFFSRSFPFPDTTESSLFDDVRAHLNVTYTLTCNVRPSEVRTHSRYLRVLAVRHQY
jgi:hypothetical protein